MKTLTFRVLLGAVAGGPGGKKGQKRDRPGTDPVDLGHEK